MKYIAIVICLLIAASHLQAQKVKFRAEDIKTGKEVMLDSVKVINLSINKSSVFNGISYYNWYDLGPVAAGVQSDGDSFAKLICGSGEITLYVTLKECSKLVIRVFDVTGRQKDRFSSYLSQGNYTFHISSAALSESMYFVNVSDGKRSRTMNFLSTGKSGDAPGGISLMQSEGNILRLNETVNSNDFMFIGYAGRLKPDTIAAYTPKDGELIVFHFNIAYNDMFSGGNIKLNIRKGIHNVKYWEYRYGSDPVYEDSTSEYVMNNEFTISQCYGALSWFGEHGGYCAYYSNPDSSIYFCCDTATKDDYETSGSYTELKLYLDTLNKFIKEIEYNRYEERYIHPKSSVTSSGHGTTREHFSLKNIPCKIENGKLTAVIKFNSCKDNCVYSKSYDYYYGNGGYSSGDSEDFLGFTNPVDDSSYIEIQLNKY